MTFSDRSARWYAGGAISDYAVRVGGAALLAVGGGGAALLCDQAVAHDQNPAFAIERPAIPAGGTAILLTDHQERAVRIDAEATFSFYR